MVVHKTRQIQRIHLPGNRSERPPGMSIRVDHRFDRLVAHLSRCLITDAVMPTF